VNNCPYCLFQGDLTLDPSMEKFVSLMKNVFNDLPYIVTESVGQIAGLDPVIWPVDEEPTGKLFLLVFNTFYCYIINISS